MTLVEYLCAWAGATAFNMAIAFSVARALERRDQRQAEPKLPPARVISPALRFLGR